MLATCSKCQYEFQTRQTDPARCHKDCKTGGRCLFALTPETDADRLALAAPSSPPLPLSPSPPLPPCLHLGPATGETILCPTCSGSVSIKTFACALHGLCTLAKPVGPRCCQSCPDWAAAEEGEGETIAAR